jgi:TRAP-type C4-dicarboxylate transport system substrate-binding protein
MKSIATLLVSIGTVAALTGCGEPATRTGAAAEPVVLAPATPGGPNVGNDVMDVLADATASGTVRVADPKTTDVGKAPDRTLQLLQDGKADIGVLRSGMLASAGARSLLALEAPLVVANNAQAAAIAADPIAETAMADLSKIGLVGLALVPGGLRHPFGYGDAPIVRASDFQGATINTRENDAGVTAIMAALGATEDHSADAERTAKAKNGVLRGIEVSLHQFAAVDRPAVVTTNVTLYAKFDVIIMRKAVWSSLSGAQQAELKTVAAAVRVSAPEARGSEQSVFADWCKGTGAASTQADDADLASLHEALDPITTKLESDPVAKKIVERMRSLRAGTADEPDLKCTGQQPAAADWKNLEPVGDQTILDGTWRFTPTEEQLLAAGATPSDARNNALVWEMTLVNGTGTATIGASGDHCTWTFKFAGDKVLFDLGPEDPCGGGAAALTAGTFKLDGDTVTFHWTEADDPYLVKLFNGIFAQAVKVTG